MDVDSLPPIMTTGAIRILTNKLPPIGCARAAGIGMHLVLHMWDHNARVKWRVGNSPTVHEWDPHAGGQERFWIDVHGDKIDFRRDRGGEHETVATINGWMETVGVMELFDD